MTSLRRSLERLTKENEKLLLEDELLRVDYDEVCYKYTHLYVTLGSNGIALLFLKCDIFTVGPVLTFL